MNASTDTQQAQAPKARRFSGRQRTFIIAGTAGALLLGGGAAAAFAVDLDEADDRAELTGTNVADTDNDDRYEQNDADDVYDTDDQYDTDNDDFALPAEAISADAAVDAALAEVAGDAYDTDLEGTVDAPVWIVEVVDADNAEWDVVVNALDGTVTDVFADNDTDDADDDNDLDDDRDGDDDADDNDDQEDGYDD